MLAYSNGSLGILPNFDFQGDIDSSKIAYAENRADPFTKSFLERVFQKHVIEWVLGVSQAYFRVSGSSLHLCSRSKTIFNFIF